MSEFVSGSLKILIYIAVCVPAVLLLRVKVKLPDEVYRKLLHCVLLGLLPVWLYAYPSWWMAVAACGAIVVLIYPALGCAERVPGYSAFITERKQGELKASAALVFAMFALVMSVCWGVFGDRPLALASVFAWGFGDAAAALTGKRFGRHKVRAAGGKKSWEGTAAMFLTSLVSVLVVLTLRGGLTWPVCVGISLVTALVSAAVELFSRDGRDTFTCPVAAMAVLILMLAVFGGL